MSLGRCYAGHSLSHKLSMAAKYGLQGIELFFEDLADIAGSTHDGPALISAAKHVRTLCESLNLEIIGLQPFLHYDGLIDRQLHAQRVEEMNIWIEIAKTLGTDIIQIPANFLPADQVSADIDLIVSDLVEVAELGLQQNPPIRFAYESLCWSTRVNTWEKCWDVVQRVDRPNFGICLDTFNILGRIYADPASPTGKRSTADEDVAASIQSMIQCLTPHKDKIFFIQVVDAERLAAPLVPGQPFYKAEQPARMSWSRNCRLFYGEQDQGAYLPVKDVLEAIFFGVGWEGWVSAELFNRAMERTDDDVVEELAGRAGAAWRRMVEDFGMGVQEHQSVGKGEVIMSHDEGYASEGLHGARL